MNKNKIVWVLAIHTERGMDMSVHRTEAGAWSNLHDMVTCWWDDDVGGVMPDDPREAIAAYFKEMDHVGWQGTYRITFCLIEK